MPDTPDNNAVIKISQLPTATSVSGTDEAALNNAGVTRKASLDKILADTGVTGHIANTNIHAPIDDISSPSETTLWSSAKIVDFINQYLGFSGPLPVQYGGTGLNTVDNGKIIYSNAANSYTTVGLANTLQVSDGVLGINIDQLRTQLGGGINIGFQPAALSKPLALWLDAAKGVTQDSGFVSRWKNLAPTGEGYDAVQSDGAKQPFWASDSGVNSYPGITFGGSPNHYLELLGAGLDIAKNVDALTVCMVMAPAYPTTEPGTVLYISGGTDADSSRFSYLINNSPSGQRAVQATRADGGAYASAVSSTIPPEAPCWDTVVMDYANAKATIYYDGVEWQSPSAISDAGNTSNTSSLAVKIGALPSGGFVLDGPVMEILVWQGKLTAAERSNLDRYLNAKYFNFNGQDNDYILYIGDSNIFGLGLANDSDRIHNQVAALLTPISGIFYVSNNFGLGGLKASDVLTYYETNYNISNLFLPNARKKYIVLGIGGNDIFAGASNTAILSNMRMIVDFYKSAGYIVLPWTTPPLDVAYNTQVSALAQSMRDNYVSYGWAGLIEANSAVVAPPSSDFQVDNTHFTAGGVAKVAPNVVSTIEGLPGYPYL
jgi:lysophospholipase L1-like esterase